MSRQARPRIRTIKPEMWQDERFADLQDLEHRLYVGLVTQADDEGRGSANLHLIRSRLFPFDERRPEDFAPALAALADAGLIDHYDVDGRSYFALTSWADDQRVDKLVPSTVPPPPDSSGTVARNREESRAVAIAPAGPDLDRDPDRDPDRVPSLRSVAAEVEEREDIEQLCNLLAEKMVENDPKAKATPDAKRWRDPMRLLIDQDGRDRQLVANVIAWCQADAFWRSNILSPAKLREKFPQLLLKMQTERGSIDGRARRGDVTAADYLAAGEDRKLASRFSQYDVAAGLTEG